VIFSEYNQLRRMDMQMGRLVKEEDLKIREQKFMKENEVNRGFFRD
jgi:hypothetical protein